MLLHESRNNQHPSFIRRHAVVFLFAILVGLLSVAPHLLAVHAIGSAYRGIPFLYLDNENEYLARMQEIVDGHPSIGSPFFYEYKNDLAVQPPLGEWAYVLLSRATGRTLPQTLVLAKFLFPAVLSLLVYAFLWRLLPADRPRMRVLGSLTGGLLVTLGYDLLSIQDVLSVLRGQDIGVHLSLWTRPVNPIVGALLVFGYLNLLWEVLLNHRRWAVPFAGVLLGASVFYFFSWGVLISVSAILVAILAMQTDWVGVKRIVLAMIVSFVVSAPYWVSTLSSVSGEAGRALALRNGMFFTHAPLLNKTLLVALVVFVLASIYLVRRGTAWREFVREPWWLISLSLLLGGLWALNQQIVTGRMIWPYHFVQYTKPFAMIVVIVVLIRAVACWPRAVTASAFLFSAFVLLQAGTAAATYRSVLSHFRERQNDSALGVWLNVNAPKDCVVLAKESDEHLPRFFIPAFTHCNTYISSWVFSGVPLERVRHNYFIYLRMNGVTADNVRAYMREHPHYVRGYFFEDWQQLFATTSDAWFSAKVEELSHAYGDFVHGDFHSQLRQYRLDYLVTEERFDAKQQAFYGITKELGHTEKNYIYAF